MAIKVYRSQCEDDLTAGQRSRLGHLMRGILSALEEYTAWRKEGEGSTSTVEMVWRPHNVFCIDGGRGAGKTHLLLTVEDLLKAIVTDRLDNKWSTTVDPQIWSALKNKIDRKTPIKSLRIIFPADLDKQEYVMEAIVATLRADIDKGIKESTTDDDRKCGRDVRQMLIDEVATGHYFARRFGVDSVSRDSLNFHDMVKKWDDLNVKAVNRTESWRTFIKAYLDWRKIGVLAILLDDSDQRPEVTYDILQTARNMFNHPQIITIIAGNTRSMRHSLLSLSMRELATIMPALNKKEHPTGEAWRRAERRQVEQEIEKILPEAKRFYLPPMGAADFMKVTDTSLEALIEGALHDLRDRFMKVKMLKAFHREILNTDLPNPLESGLLEEYMSWWIFQTQYIGKLRPFSPRQARTFGEYFDGRAIEAAHAFDALLQERDAQKVRHASTAASQRMSAVAASSEALPALKTPRRSHLKRLSVALFENSSNYALLQRVEDEDNHVVEWLSRQKLDSKWGEKRAFVINDHRVEAGTYSYDFLTYRIDLGLALPLQENPDKIAPAGLMPLMLGRKRIRPFYRPHGMPTRPRLLGLAGLMGHAAIPGNCLYFHQLNTLPASAFVPDEKHMDRTSLATSGKGGEWEEQLHSFWPEILDRDQDEAVQDYLIRLFTDLKAPDKRTDSTADLVVELRKQAAGTDAERASYRDFLKDELNHSDGEMRETDRKTRARHSALFSDLRRNWHALRIWNAARTPGPADDSFVVSTQSLLNKISASDRMEIYTLEKLIDDTLRQDYWVAGALNIFGRLVPKLDEFEDNADRKNPPEDVGLDGAESTGVRAFIDSLDLDLAAPDADGNLPRISPEEWAAGWRRLGRKTCKYWPPRDPMDAEDASRPANKIVSKLFDGEWEHYRVEIFGDSETSDTLGDDRDPRESEKVRSVRAFIWLMYGLAPGLPAMIHADIVAFRRFAIQNAVDAPKIDQDVRKRLRRWANLIVRLSAILRYLKYKCLTMYIVSTLTHIKRDYLENGDFVAPDSEMKKITRFIRIVERRASEPADETKRVKDKTEELEAGEFFRSMYDYFVPSEIVAREKGNDRSDPSWRDINIMPDASPSTLFGDKWMENLFVRARREAKGLGEEGAIAGTYRGVSFEGVFGETERWLWAANEMTRCLWDEVGKSPVEAKNHAPAPGAPSVPPAPEAEPALPPESGDTVSGSASTGQPAPPYEWHSLAAAPTPGPDQP